MPLCLALCLVLGAGSATAGKLGRTEISNIPWQPPEPGPQGRHGASVIYGPDDRIDAYAEADPNRFAWTRSTCGLVRTNRLSEQPDGSYTFSLGQYRALGLPPCEGERFASQPTLAYCTGFMVGPDLIATAGHCFNTSDLATVAFVFGFVMLDAETPVEGVPADHVYRGVELVGHMNSNLFDYAVIRVDRPITAPGAVPLPIRREGTIPVGTQVGVIGHPAGLPLKLAFGNTTVVRDNAPASHFVANLDTYGGNSGSPVFNATTGVVEGILVRGATDYVSQGNCFVSNVLSDTGGRGEDCSKTVTFMHLIPELAGTAGTLDFDRMFYTCDGVLAAEVTDSDLAGEGSIAIPVFTSNGDEETLTLFEDGSVPGIFRGEIAIAAGAATPGDGVLNVVNGADITGVYLDEDDGTGSAVEVVATAFVDCTPPVITSVEEISVGSTQASIAVSTDKPTRATIRFGASCGGLEGAVTTPGFDTDHVVSLSPLTASSTVHYVVEAEDAASNVTATGPPPCFSLETADQTDYLTQWFSSGGNNALAFKTATFTPDNGPNGYTVCIEAASEYPVPLDGADPVALQDDDSVEIPLPDGNRVFLYGIGYTRFFLGSNGYITLESSDVTFAESLANHFSQPRISPLYIDFNPVQGGTVYLELRPDRAVVTYHEVSEYFPNFQVSNKSSVQLEMFFNGVIRMTWLELESSTGIVGLSRGGGVPLDFVMSDYGAYPGCGGEGEGEGEGETGCHSADLNCDFQISIAELLRLIQFFNHALGYHCMPGSDDGYAPGDGPRDCTPHDSDYNPQNWRISISEVLRLVQFFNLGGYAPDPDGEDGFRVAL